MGTAVRPAKTSPGPWDAFADVGVFVDEWRAIGGAHAGILRNRAPWSSIVAPAARRRVASGATSTKGRRSGASRSRLPSTNTASPWRSMSRRRTGMIRKASSLSCASSPMEASRVRPWAISATGASGWQRRVRRSASPSRRSLAAETDGSFPPASAGWWNVLCLAEPLPAVEYHRRALEGAPHRFRRDRVHLDPLSPPKAPRRRGTQRLTSTNRHSATRKNPKPVGSRVARHNWRMPFSAANSLRSRKAASESVQLEKPRDVGCGVNRRLLDEAARDDRTLVDRVGMR